MIDWFNYLRIYEEEFMLNFGLLRGGNKMAKVKGESATAKLNQIKNKPAKTSNRKGSANNTGANVRRAGDVSIRGGK